MKTFIGGKKAKFRYLCTLHLLNLNFNLHTKVNGRMRRVVNYGFYLLLGLRRNVQTWKLFKMLSNNWELCFCFRRVLTPAKALLIFYHILTFSCEHFAAKQIKTSERKAVKQLLKVLKFSIIFLLFSHTKRKKIISDVSLWNNFDLSFKLFNWWCETFPCLV